METVSASRSRSGNIPLTPLLLLDLQVRRAGFDPEKYISFYNLRSYDRINSPWQTIRKMEQNVSRKPSMWRKKD